MAKKTSGKKKTSWTRVVEIFYDAQFRSGKDFGFAVRGMRAVNIARYLLDVQKIYLRPEETQELTEIISKGTPQYKLREPRNICPNCNIILADEPVMRNRACPKCKHTLKVVIPMPTAEQPYAGEIVDYNVYQELMIILRKPIKTIECDVCKESWVKNDLFTCPKCGYRFCMPCSFKDKSRAISLSEMMTCPICNYTISPDDRIEPLPLAKLRALPTFGKKIFECYVIHGIDKPLPAWLFIEKCGGLKHLLDFSVWKKSVCEDTNKRLGLPRRVAFVTLILEDENGDTEPLLVANQIHPSLEDDPDIAKTISGVCLNHSYKKFQTMKFTKEIQKLEL